MAARIWSIPDLPEGSPLPVRLEALTGEVYLAAGSILTPALKIALTDRGIPGFLEAEPLTSASPVAPHQYFQTPEPVITLDPPHIQRLLRAALPLQTTEQADDVAAEGFLRHLYQQTYAALDQQYLAEITANLLAWAAQLPGPPALAPATGRPDSWLVRHVLQSAQWTAWIGVHLGLPQILLSSVVLAALLRDVGQMAAPAEILYTGAPLDAQGRATIAEHPIYSVAWLSATQVDDEEALRTIRQHHERFDGRGYPFQLPGPALCEGAQILALADTFAAVASQRPWRPARTLAAAVQALIQGSGTQFNPDLVRLFVQQVGPYPPGSILELDRRQRAIVLASRGTHRWRPQVQIIERLNGQIQLSEPIELAQSPAQVTSVLR